MNRHQALSPQPAPLEYRRIHAVEWTIRARRHFGEGGIYGVHFCWLCAILLVGLFLRAWPLSESLWVDELHTAWTVSNDLSDVLPRARLGNNGPLYFWLIYGVTQIAGLHEWSLRFASLLSGAGLILATFALAHKWECSPASSLLAAGLVAIDTNAVYFSCEARTYALVQLVAIAHLYLGWRLITSRRPGIGVVTVWFITAMLLFHLHCTTALVFVAEMVAYVIALLSVPQQVKLSPLLLVIGLGAIAVGTLPAVGLLEIVADRRENWELFVKQRPFLATLNIFPLHTYVVVPLVASACLGAVMRWLPKNTERIVADEKGSDSHCRDRPSGALRNGGLIPFSYWVPLVLCVSWLMVPIIAAWLLTELDVARLFFRRYVVSSGVALAPLTALVLTVSTRSRQQGWAVAAIGLVAVFTLSPAKYALSGFQALSHSGENWRDAVALLATTDRNTPVLLRSGLIEADDWSRSDDHQQREYCLLPIRGIYRLPERDAPVIPLRTSLPVVLAKEEINAIAGYPHAWLTVRGPREPVEGVISVEEVVQSVLVQLEHRFAVKQTFEFGGVSVIELVVIGGQS